MARFTICAEYKVPYYRVYNVEAETAEQAAKMVESASSEDPAFFDSFEADYDSSSETTFEHEPGLESAGVDFEPFDKGDYEATMKPIRDRLLSSRR